MNDDCFGVRIRAVGLGSADGEPDATDGKAI